MTVIRTTVKTVAVVAIAGGVTLDALALSQAAIHTNRLTVNRHGVVQHSTLPHCEVEDASSGPVPCTWNIGRPVDGNGDGLAYWVGRDDRVHYVWRSDPTAGSSRWRWVSRQLADALAEGGGPRADIRPWERCVFVASGPEQMRIAVRCPDGTTVTA